MTIYPPPHKSAHNNTVCTDSNGKQTSKTSTAEAIPLPPFCYALPAVLFLAFCIARTGRKNNRIHMTQKQSRKQTQRKSKSKENKQSGKASHTQTRSQKSKQKGKQTSTNTSKKADRAIILKYQARKSKHKKTIKTSKAIYKHLTISKGKKAKQDKEKSKRDPRKAYKQTSKEGKGKAILFPPMPIYRIAYIYYNKAIKQNISILKELQTLFL